MITRKLQINNEYYVGSSINNLIAEGKVFKIFDIEQWISFGDPFELNMFEYWDEYFFKQRKKSGMTLRK